MSDRWTDRLSEYVDDALPEAERAALETHLTACPECRAAAEELRRVRDRARGVVDRPPAADLWPGIAARLASKHDTVRLESVRARRRLAFTVPQLAAAALVLMCVSGGSVWLLERPGEPAPSAALPGVALTPSESVFVNVALHPATYDAAVADLQRVLARRRNQLDSATVRVLETNLHTIDRAIAEARAALARDPASAYLNEHLAATMARKLELLRQAAAIAVAS